MRSITGECRGASDCDLAAFLEQDYQHDKDSMVWKWLICISNALAFIRFKGVRHKNIKPRNMLVKGEEIFFTDFGSSHAFIGEGNSTTEGPSFGHTKMYCAPAVIHQGKRNRSTDVFSLGCVFTQLLVWLYNHWSHAISGWHDSRETNAQGFTILEFMPIHTINLIASPHHSQTPPSQTCPSPSPSPSRPPHPPRIPPLPPYPASP